MKKILFAAVILAAGMLASCKGGANDDPYAGKTNPSTICEKNLIAYFPFDGAATETINKVEPKVVGTGVCYEAGRRGKAYKGAAKNELKYDIKDIKRLGEAKDFSFACWMKHQAVPQSSAPVPYFFGLTNDTDFWGQFAFMDERGGADNTDSLNIKVAINDQWAAPGLGKCNVVAGRWAHIVGSYKMVNDTLRTFDFYVNGVAVEDMHQEFTGNLPTDFSKATMLLFGQFRQKAFENATDEWMGNMDGDLDEVRLYDAALTAEDAKKLYDAEVSVID